VLAALASVVAALLGAVDARADATAPAECATEGPAGTTVRSPYAPSEVEAAMQSVWAETALPGDNPASYLIHVPEQLPPGPVPLVVTVHGLAGNAKQHLSQTHWTEIADREGFLVAAPNGRRSWDNSQGSADVAFIRDVVADVRARDCVDDRRIYITGHSNGGFMTHRLACESGDLFAAGASYAAGDVSGFPHESPCAANGVGHDGRPITGFRQVPLALWHGTADGIVAYQGGRRGLRGWLERYDCDTVTPRVDDVFGGWEHYGSCAAPDVELVFRTLADHGHAWPDGCGGQQSTGGTAECTPEAGTGPWPVATDLADELWRFLAAHERGEPAATQSPPALDPPTGPHPDDVPGWIDHGVGTGIDSEPAFLRDEPPVVDGDGIEIHLVLRVQTGGDGAGVGPSHPVCPTANAGPSTQSRAGRTVTVSATDVDGRVHAADVVTEPVVVTAADGRTEHVELVTASLPGAFDASNTVLRARYDGDMVGFWWGCGTPRTIYKETISDEPPCRWPPRGRPPETPPRCR
jgi:poly(3-hydroxybutyrate) depolymerase